MSPPPDMVFVRTPKMAGGTEPTYSLYGFDEPRWEAREKSANNLLAYYAYI